MVRATIVVLSWLARVIPVQAWAGWNVDNAPAKAKTKKADDVLMFSVF